MFDCSVMCFFLFDLSLFLFLICLCFVLFFFFFNDTATTEIYTLSLHDALPISQVHAFPRDDRAGGARSDSGGTGARGFRRATDRKSTRLNSSHLGISYAVFCLKKKKKKKTKR